MPTGYLYEAGIRLLEPRFYNGTLSSLQPHHPDGFRLIYVPAR